MHKYFNKLFVFDLANNHQGSVSHGLRIIKEIAAVCDNFKDCGFQFAFKLQYRDLDTFIHPDYKDSDSKYVKRFRETRLTEAEYLQLKNAIVDAGFISACTPFDEASVDLIEKHGFDIIKIASCSFTDWPLLERIALTDKPIIASTAGASLEDIDRVVSFFEHRKKDFALMHCVAEYPTPIEHLNFGQVAFLKNRYNCPVGLSEHLDEESYISDPLFDIYECHVKTGNGNNYSKNQDMIYSLLSYSKKVYNSYGVYAERYVPSAKEIEALRGLQRGVYIKHAVHEHQTIKREDVYFAIPLQEGQISASEFSKYKEFKTTAFHCTDTPLCYSNVIITDSRSRVLEIVQKLIPIIKESGVVLPERCELELSAHYGLDKFEEYGAAIFTIINREYAKKILVMLPGQQHPVHKHDKKEETFTIQHGELLVTTCGTKDVSWLFNKGTSCLIQRKDKHGFETKIGCVFEEISTTHYADDSFYTDPKVLKDRKTKITFRKEWLTEGVR